MRATTALALVPIALLSAAAVSWLLWNLATSSGAAGSTPGGRLAFSAPSDDDRFSRGWPADLYVIDADGSSRRRVAHCEDPPKAAPSARRPPSGCMLRAFAWSPDGGRMAFVRGDFGGVDTAPDVALFVVRPDGEEERRIDGCGKSEWPSCGDFYGSQPAWAPDGSRLIVPRDGALYVFTVDRSRFRRLSPRCGTTRCFDMHPAWSPDGSKIVFARLVAPRRQILYSIRPDGSDLIKLTDLPGQAGHPAWSPDGRAIAFDFWNEFDSRLYLMDADGSNLRLLRSGSNASGPGVPAWSPDGSEIAYVTTPAAGTVFSLEIWVTKLPGNERRRLYRSPLWLETWGRPVWSPNGKYIAFGVGLSDEPEKSGIYLVNRDGTGLRKLVDSPTEAAWQPSP